MTPTKAESGSPLQDLSDLPELIIVKNWNDQCRLIDTEIPHVEESIQVILHIQCNNLTISRFRVEYIKKG